jgi:hypothetical protein
MFYVCHIVWYVNEQLKHNSNITSNATIMCRILYKLLCISRQKRMHAVLNTYYKRILHMRIYICTHTHIYIYANISIHDEMLKQYKCVKNTPM